MEVSAFYTLFPENIHSICPQLADEIGRRIDFIQLSVVHQGNPVAEGLCLFDVMGRKQDRKSPVIQLMEKIPHLSAGNGIHSGSRLI